MPALKKVLPQEESLATAIELARLGRKQEARRLLRDACSENPANAEAWLWNASLAETVPDAVDCLTHVLALDPENVTARNWFARVDIF